MHMRRERQVNSADEWGGRMNDQVQQLIEMEMEKASYRNKDTGRFKLGVGDEKWSNRS